MLSLFALAAYALAACDPGEPICSDGVVDEGEECDDGNLEDGDGCSAGCQLEAPEPACGDGTIDPGEVCDDGNAMGGDGCSAACEPDDDLSTPGDDRAGYLRCSQLSGAVSCGPDEGCCTIDELRCAASEDSCKVPLYFHTCDGPEDCAEGEQCWTQNKFVGCSAESTSYLTVYCHTDADCIEPELNPCGEAGQCIGDRINIPGYEPVCGNGYLDLNESCDDGNTVDGDGCSSSCQLGAAEDDPATPGDDRPGYVGCSQVSPNITCSPGTLCCYAGSPLSSSCTETTDECSSFDLCDGPEDCSGGLRCGEQDGVFLCTRFPSYLVRCHTDADCADPATNPCIEGTCLP